MKVATAGTNIQSTMTVFKPRGHRSLGTRFWSSEYIRYAAYKDESGKIMGDPANLELTQYLLEHNLWTPPNPKTPFNVLPIVIKSPDWTFPYVFKLPEECFFEVPIKHPTRPEITNLGYKWTTIPDLQAKRCNEVIVVLSKFH